MDYITVNESFSAALRLPDSANGNAVTYVIYKTSDGSVFATGSAAFIASEYWRVTFTPTSLNETYIVHLIDSTADRTVSQHYKAVASAVATTVDTTDTDNAALLAQVNAAIRDRLNGGGTQMYTIGGRTVQYISLSELMKWRDQLRREINSALSPNDTQTHAKFMRPS